MGFLTRDPLIPGTCEWCGCPTKGENYATCSPSCEAKLYAADRDLGLKVVTALKLWRRHRGRKATPGEGKIGAVAALIDEGLKEGTARRRRLALARQKAQYAEVRKSAMKLTERQREVLLAISGGQDVTANKGVAGTLKALTGRGYIGPNNILSETGALAVEALKGPTDAQT